MDEKNGFTVTLTEEERKAANRERQKRYYERHKNDKEYKDKRAEYGVKYRANHKEELAAKKAEWYQQNKEKIAEHRQLDKEKIAANREAQKRYYQKNKEKKAVYRAEYRANNKGKILEQRAEYRSTPFGRAACLVGAYRLADKKYNRGECTIDAKWIVDNIFSGQPCHYCGETDWKLLGVDRKDSSLPHTKENCVPCCRHCNTKKQKTPYEEYMRMIGKIA